MWGKQLVRLQTGPATTEGVGNPQEDENHSII